MSSSSECVRRFLQNLQKRIRAFPLKVVHRIDNGDTPAALARGRAEKRHCPPHVVNPDHRVELAGLLVDASFQHQEIVCA